MDGVDGRATPHTAVGASGGSTSDARPISRASTIAVWGLTYKPGTDTLRRSAAIELCRVAGRARRRCARARSGWPTALPADASASRVMTIRSTRRPARGRSGRGDRLADSTATSTRSTGGRGAAPARARRQPVSGPTLGDDPRFQLRDAVGQPSYDSTARRPQCCHHGANQGLGLAIAARLRRGGRQRADVRAR